MALRLSQLPDQFPAPVQAFGLVQPGARRIREHDPGSSLHVLSSWKVRLPVRTRRANCNLRYAPAVHADPPEDYYALLGVDPDVDAVQLRRIWRQLALRWHPDRAGPSATATFQKLSIAYAVLSDPVARAGNGQAHGKAAAPPPSAAPRRPPDDFRWRICGSFKALLARGVARRDEDGVVELFLNRQEAATGGM